MTGLVELWWETIGRCDHGPKPIGAQRTYCEHRLMSPFGHVEHTAPRPDRGEVGHLMLTTPCYTKVLLEQGPQPNTCNPHQLDSVTVEAGKLFAHIHFQGEHWVWELFDTVWRDEDDWPVVQLGRWPD